jgi:hypothetical protein
MEKEGKTSANYDGMIQLNSNCSDTVQFFSCDKQDFLTTQHNTTQQTKIKSEVEVITQQNV